jgi:FkbM family methyltransferase
MPAQETATAQPDTVRLSGFNIRVDPIRYGPKIAGHMMQGSYEGAERATIPRILAKSDKVLEIGAATGLISMLCASIVGPENVIAFEANPEMIDDALYNYGTNGLSVKLFNGILQNRAVFSGPGTQSSFYIDQEFWASNATGSPNKRKVSVPCFCFEEIAEDFGANALICDIEGGEIELIGMADLSRFTKMLIEIHYWAGRAKINAMMRHLVLSGFSIDFELSSRSVVALHRGLTPPWNSG